MVRAIWPKSSQNCRTAGDRDGYIRLRLRQRSYDFLGDILGPLIDQADWIITNPPFRSAEQFTLRALDFARDRRRHAGPHSMGRRRRPLL